MGWLFRYVVLAGLGLVFATLVAGRWTFRHYAQLVDAEAPALDSIEDYEALAPGVTRIYAADGTVLAMHNSWDDTNGQRHAVPLRTMRAFVNGSTRYLG